ncbi:sulfotransferase [Halarcobacter sp.]|uniref:sulfotransferase family protein n=1 Tax=Halarcobacter sp. TaxID=2321133 RepID=UPI0029F54536|nr:sulfotransferase [Halarcobacter sp.]
MSKIKFITDLKNSQNGIKIPEALGLASKLDKLETITDLKKRLCINDPVVRVFIFTQLDNFSNVDFENRILNIALKLAKHSEVLRTILIQRFSRELKFDLLNKIYELEEKDLNSVSEFNKQLINAELNLDYNKMVDIYQNLFIYTGNMKYFQFALDIAADNLSGDLYFNLLIKKLFMAEGNEFSVVFINILRALEREGKFDLIYDISLITQELEEAKILRGYNIALNIFAQKNYQKCIDFMTTTMLIKATENSNMIFLNLATKCFEKLKDYKKAIKYYKKQNLLQINSEYSLSKYISWVDKLASFEPNEKIEDEGHDNYFIMTGFPRSGTTLLENALASHHAITTCEETSSFITASNISFKSHAIIDPFYKNIDSIIKDTQKLYYKNLNRYIKNKNCTCIIDKTPIMSSNIRYLEKVFPNKKYIFSIRHPYDVVISNYKQIYKPNMAMAAFNDFYDSCVFYNKVMTDWFNVFPEETSRVHYIYYDDLVLNFQNEMEKVLNFLKLEWTDEVLNFVEHSKKRPVKTPSYENVRKGLSLGVQSSWKNYEFLFDKKCRALLDPWVEKFGYNKI